MSGSPSGSHARTHFAMAAVFTTVLSSSLPAPAAFFEPPLGSLAFLSALPLPFFPFFPLPPPSSESESWAGGGPASSSLSPPPRLPFFPPLFSFLLPFPDGAASSSSSSSALLALPLLLPPLGLLASTAGLASFSTFCLASSSPNHL